MILFMRLSFNANNITIRSFNLEIDYYYYLLLTFLDNAYVGYIISINDHELEINI